MKFSASYIGAILLSGSLFVSCSDDNDPISTPALEVPSTYTFERNGATTIDFSGQSARLLMLDAIGAQFSDAATNGTVVDVNGLNNMYSNSNSAFASAELNNSGKNIKSKTSASSDYFSTFMGGGSTTEKVANQAYFESQFAAGALASQGNPASAGVAGSYLDGSRMRLFDANGLEPQQVVLKGLMGAMMLDQISNHYLSTLVLDQGSNVLENTNKVLSENANYTTMEHYWDEAYGYVYGADNASANSKKYWSSYIDQVNADADFNTVTNDINAAFRTGRSAIVANKYEIRNQQIETIQSKLALVAAVRAVFYLQDGKAKLVADNGAKSFHALSEAYGFIMSLRYSRQPNTENPYFTKSEIDAMLATLLSGENGFWDVDTLSPKLDAVSNQIATKFGFTVAQAATVN